MELRINQEEDTHDISSLAGLFFEDINYAGDGGLYGELLPNRSFEFSREDGGDFYPLYSWAAVGEADLQIMAKDGPFRNNPHYVQVDGAAGEPWGIENSGYNQGIPLGYGEFRVTIYARGSVSDQQLTVSLITDDEESLSSSNIWIGTNWKKIELVLSCKETDRNGKFRIVTPIGQKFQLAYVSLFPKETFKGRKNGLRKDISEALAAMKPRFLRFPGGCLVHAGSLNKEDRNSIYRWKNTVEAVEERAYKVAPWQYPQSYGLGFFEFFQFCEDIGCEAIPVISGGCNPHEGAAWPLDDFQEWIDEALDLIEFATGPAESHWGQKRAALGHVEPFSLNYLAIGNEESQPEFFERYHLIHEAMKKAYPEIQLVNTSGCFCSGGDYEQGWQSARCEGSEFVDEHYYQAPEWFIANHDHYQDYPKNGPKVFLGEYASKDNGLYHALAEASYLVGLQKSPAVGLACYAPMLCNTDHVNWQPDMIFYDSTRLVLTSSYYVQKIFMNNLGERNIPLKMSCKEQDWEERKAYRRQITGEASISVGSGNPDTHLWNIQVENLENGEVLKFPDTVFSLENRELALGDIPWHHYRINFVFSQKITDSEADKLINLEFGRHDERNYCSWVLGQWLNAQNQITEHTDGYVSALQQFAFSIEDQRPYQLELTVKNNQISTMIDGTVYHDVSREPILVPPVYGALSSSGDIWYLKLVNLQDKPCEVAVDLRDLEVPVFSVKTTLLTGELETENTLDQPDLLQERNLPVKTVDSRFTEKVPAHSFMVLCLEPLAKHKKGLVM